jgi:hypothetical protein
MELVARSEGKERAVTVEAQADGRFRVVVDGKERVFEARKVDATGWTLLVDGKVVRADVDYDKNGDPVVELGGVSFPLKLAGKP